MSTSLGSNTYNRQNWEDAVSPGERPGQALRPPAAGRVSGWGAGQSREAALGAGRAARGERRRGCRGSPGPEDGAPCPVLPALRRGLGCSGAGEALRQLRGLIWARPATFFSAEASPGWAQCRQWMPGDAGGGVCCCSQVTGQLMSPEDAFGWLVCLNIASDRNS